MIFSSSAWLTVSAYPDLQHNTALSLAAKRAKQRHIHVPYSPGTARRTMGNAAGSTPVRGTASQPQPEQTMWVYQVYGARGQVEIYCKISLLRLE